MGRYAGIDIGSAHTYSCVLDTDSRQFHYPNARMDLEETVKWLGGFDRLDGGCIDGPPNPNTGQLAILLPVSTKHNTNRRYTEFKLSIGGCYSTRAEPPNPGATNFWMRSAFDLFQLLEGEFGWSINRGGQDGPLIETHPTYAFKALLGCNRNVVDGIERLRLDPNSSLRRKHSSAGHQQRIELLTALCAEIDLGISDILFQKWNQQIDWVDAAICAFMSSWQQSGHHELESPGDSSEGAIFLRVPKKPFTVTSQSPNVTPQSPTVTTSRSARTGNGSRSSQATAPVLPLNGVSTPANAIIMRLGDTQDLSQLDTIDTILSSDDLDEFWLPCVSKAMPQLSSNLEKVGGRLFLSFGADLRIALNVSECRKDNPPLRYLADTTNPWPFTEGNYWLRIDNFMEINTDRFYVNQHGEWTHGFGGGQTAMLWAVVPALASSSAMKSNSPETLPPPANNYADQD